MLISFTPLFERHVQELMFELRQYDEQAAKQSKGERSAGLIPPDTKLSIKLVASRPSIIGSRNAQHCSYSH